jgi:hypothetical protein
MCYRFHTKCIQYFISIFEGLYTIYNPSLAKTSHIEPEKYFYRNLHIVVFYMPGDVLQDLQR